MKALLNYASLYFKSFPSFILDVIFILSSKTEIFLEWKFPFGSMSCRQYTFEYNYVTRTKAWKDKTLVYLLPSKTQLDTYFLPHSRSLILSAVSPWTCSIFSGPQRMLMCCLLYSSFCVAFLLILPFLIYLPCAHAVFRKFLFTCIVSDRKFLRLRTYPRIQWEKHLSLLTQK